MRAVEGVGEVDDAAEGGGQRGTKGRRRGVRAQKGRGGEEGRDGARQDDDGARREGDKTEEARGCNVQGGRRRAGQRAGQRAEGRGQGTKRTTGPLTPLTRKWGRGEGNVVVWLAREKTVSRPKGGGKGEGKRS